MSVDNNDWMMQLGLSSGEIRKAVSDDIVISAGASDPQTGLLVSLTSETKFDEAGNLSDINLQYWRHRPYGKSQSQNVIRASFKKTAAGDVEADKIYVQSRLVYDSARDDLNDPETQKNVNRVIGAVQRLNTRLRRKDPVEDTARILSECNIPEVTGESLVLPGLNDKGGFALDLSSYFMSKANDGAAEKFSLGAADIDTLKTVLGFHVNTLEPSKNYTDSRTVVSTDSDSGVQYKAQAALKETARKLSLNISIEPEKSPQGIDPKGIPALVDLSFSKRTGDRYVLDKATYLGQKIELNDTKSILQLIGIAQSSNNDFSVHKYPAFMNSAAEFDMLDKISPFNTPPALDKGGEFLYGSLHGCGFEKKIEDFGDQIGAAALFLHRGLKADGSESTVGVAVDFPFASGGPNSEFDGAVPDYLPFWDDIQAFAFTHDHFDHNGGFPYYCAKGLMKGKTIYATDRVKRALKEQMSNMQVPASLQPKIEIVHKEGAFPVYDEDKNVRMWVQHNANATKHSALCTPFIVTGCMNDDHYSGSVLIYGDGRGFKKRAKQFFEKGTRLLPQYAQKLGLKVTAKKVDRNITVALHDVTGVLDEGYSPVKAEVEDNLSVVFNWFDDKGIVFSPISTNNDEYMVGMGVAHNTGRHITAVGANAEKRLSSMNMYGVLEDKNLRYVYIRPLDELKKPEEDRLIPTEILESYVENLKWKESLDPKSEDYEEKLAEADGKWKKDVGEKLPPTEDGHEQSVHEYITKSLQEHGDVRFRQNNINDYLMYRAIQERQEHAIIRATRNTKLGKSFRSNPENLLICVTGTQGGTPEKFSTLQKFILGKSLLDADESVRSTGYKINADDYAVVITQPAIPGNADSQEKMVHDLVRNRDMPVVKAFKNGFAVFNPKQYKDKIINSIKEQGWKYELKSDGSIRVYGVPIHIHGHGFKENIREMAQAIKADMHTCHHIPGPDSLRAFNDLMDEEGNNRSTVTPDDFQFNKVDARARKKAEKYKTVAHINESYILVRMIRKFGQFYGGYLDWQRKTMLRSDGRKREDGLGVRSAGEGNSAMQQLSVQVPWEEVSNPNKYHKTPVKYRNLGPAANDVSRPRRPRSRPIWSSKRNKDKKSNGGPS